MEPHGVKDSTSDFDSEGEGSNPSVATKLYLIAHKVRGQPAFDIAEQCEIAGEEAWIISTSGHRAYPYWQHELNDNLFRINAMDFLCAMPPDLPDHFPAKAAKEPKSSPGAGKSLLAQLGLAIPTIPPGFKRRI